MDQNTSFRPLKQTPVSQQGCHVREDFNPPPVTLISPATQVMTDLGRVPSATIASEASLDEANLSMILRGVRLLLVTGGDRKVAGVITSADVLGERPVQVAQRQQVRRADLRVKDIMVPVDAMEVLHLEDVQRANVGAIVATLKAAGRAHALVVSDVDYRQTLVGVFSASQIARQLGVQIHTHEMARTFAEIEALIAGV